MQTGDRFEWIDGVTKWEDIDKGPRYRLEPMPRPPRSRFITHPHYWAGVAVALAVMAVLVVVGSW